MYRVFSEESDGSLVARGSAPTIEQAKELAADRIEAGEACVIKDGRGVVLEWVPNEAGTGGVWVDPDDDADEKTDVVYCGFPTCDNEAVTEVPVSNGADHVEMRPACYACSEVYHTGAQYGRFRAYRQIESLDDENRYALAECLANAAQYVRYSADDPALESEGEDHG